MVSLDYYAGAGYALGLLAKSQFHENFDLGDYFRVEILPPLWANQTRFYVTEKAVPTAMVTWAWISEDVEKAIHTEGRALHQNEWNSGDRLFFNDWITPYGNIRHVVKDMRTNVFPDHKATSVRRNPDGTVYKVCHWQSIAQKNEKREAVA